MTKFEAIPFRLLAFAAKFRRRKINVYFANDQNLSPPVPVNLLEI
jgi:hypothetical protein